MSKSRTVPNELTATSDPRRAIARSPRVSSQRGFHNCSFVGQLGNLHVDSARFAFLATDAYSSFALFGMTTIPLSVTKNLRRSASRL